MISEFSAKAKSKNNNAKILFFALLGLAVATVAVYISLDKFKGVVGLFAVAFITAAVFIYTKYMS